jgi:thiol-disulfide isomerase/thioredoxin
MDLYYRSPRRFAATTVLLWGLLLALPWGGGANAQGAADIDWVTGRETGEPRVHLYFFWSRSCPHCRQALPFVQAMASEYDWLALHSHELTSDRANVALYIEMADKLGRDARSVPAFFLCGRMLTGYDNAEGIGAQLRELAQLCRPAEMAEALSSGTDGPSMSAPRTDGREIGSEPVAESLRVPVLGEVDAHRLSLPLFTLLIAGLDAFNPCAFFVLLFLLSLMVHARSRARMLVVGATFVFFSGLVYFLFMAAWLNLFLVIGGAPVVTLLAGLVALLIGALNVKDFFLFQRGPSLSIPEQAKPGLYRRMRGLLSAESLSTMLFGTIALALAANSYELLCTAGFPMVYTRVLTLNGLNGWGYYAYLALYNLIYVLPLLAIVLAFTFTLGARKMSERQGRVLKLLSGVMMLGLGLAMLIAPESLGSPWIGAGLLALAVAVTALAVWLTREVTT